MRIHAKIQARRILMAQAQTAITEIQADLDLSNAEMLLLLAKVSTSILGYEVRDEYRELETDA